MASFDLPAGNPDFPAAVLDIEAGDETSAELILGGGCFWCTEAVYLQLQGVTAVESGYAGGEADTANYNAVCSGMSGHAEIIKITYNPQQISFATLLKVFFSVAHDHTQLNRQGNDRGTQYRSAVFYANDKEHAVARAYIDQLNEADIFEQPIATTLEPLDVFYPAEAHHQNYAARNPSQPYITGVSMPKVDKLKRTYSDMLKT